MLISLCSADNEFFKLTIQEIDILALFISNINEKHIAQVVINQFKLFILNVGSHLSQSQWTSFIHSIKLLFETTSPTSLIEEKERYQESHVEGSSLRGRIDLHKKAEEGGGGGDRQAELPFNQEACFNKCIIQLLLINTVNETVEKYYEVISLSVLIIL
jgi:hypothetical protein